MMPLIIIELCPLKSVQNIKNTHFQMLNLILFCTNHFSFNDKQIQVIHNLEADALHYSNFRSC